jgi:hypothetical protein
LLNSSLFFVQFGDFQARTLSPTAIPPRCPGSGLGDVGGHWHVADHSGHRLRLFGKP